MRLGIVGVGIVGRAMAEYYANGHELWTVDKKDKDYEKRLKALNENAKVVFIAVSTPYDHKNGGLDCSQVHAAVDALTGEKTIIIKSTCMPGVTDAVQAKHPEHRVFFVPEFLSEATAAEDYAKPRRPHVVGCPAGWPRIDFERYGWKGSATDPVSSWSLWSDILPGNGMLRTLHNPEGVKFLSAYQAELLKLATNGFYAMKVTFANELADIGATQEMLGALGEDPWIVNSHFNLTTGGYRGFSGACLPKDTKALSILKDDHENIFELIHTLNINRLKAQGIDIN